MDYKIVLILAAVGFLIWIVTDISQIRSDNMRMNTTLNRIARKVGAFDTLKDELKKLILEDERIKAIKLYRESTGCGLVEAKEYIDSLKAELNKDQDKNE
ncbi:ribosomal protein L7/L12 [Clostridium coskatii]|uniref:50S ribosomal protein L7/L12 n=1 Tax=Clostridium coskatii TaxID=1705578 RepID=A0A166SM48_9CLOT|nr:ribosomal protein L7/L12 [Clostridium coskatii]OAA92513.1 50S ribosomal protein L7/L12 [Clostridium coskatii]OBR92277.1 50S ribosomal protein L7/L12 [Clostridium coskatii]